MPDPHFPGDVKAPFYCLGTFPACSSSHYPHGVVDRATALLKDFQLIVSPRRAKLNPGQFFLVRYKDVQHVVLTLSYLKAPFTCEIARFSDHPRGTELVGTILSLAPLVEQNAPGFYSLPLQTEHEWGLSVAQEILGLGEEIEWLKLSVKCERPPPGVALIRLCDVKVTAATVVDLETERENQRKSDLVAMALRALQRSSEPWQNRRPPAKRIAKDPRWAMGNGQAFLSRRILPQHLSMLRVACCMLSDSRPIPPASLNSRCDGGDERRRRRKRRRRRNKKEKDNRIMRGGGMGQRSWQELERKGNASFFFSSSSCSASSSKSTSSSWVSSSSFCSLLFHYSLFLLLLLLLPPFLFILLLSCRSPHPPRYSWRALVACPREPCVPPARSTQPRVARGAC
eukprot:9486507-Pyramimonas_sp.AAC.1